MQIQWFIANSKLWRSGYHWTLFSPLPNCALSGVWLFLIELMWYCTQLVTRVRDNKSNVTLAVFKLDIVWVNDMDLRSSQSVMEPFLELLCVLRCTPVGYQALGECGEFLCQVCNNNAVLRHGRWTEADRWTLCRFSGFIKSPKDRQHEAGNWSGN